MIAQYIFAALVLAGIVYFIVRLNMAGRAETKRRALLPLEEQQRLAAEDAHWQQRYGP